VGKIRGARPKERTLAMRSPALRKEGSGGCCIIAENREARVEILLKNPAGDDA
jgi:hypothetical protein